MEPTRPGSPAAVHARWRQLFRGAFLAAVVVALGWDIAGDWVRGILPSLSPFTAASAGLVSRTVGWSALAALAVVLLAALRRRWFCRYVCPTGLLLELPAWPCRRVRHHYRRFPSLGKWFVWATIAGALVGYPLFIWLDPLAILASFIQAASRLGAAIAIAVAAPMLILFSLSLLWPGLWCRRICPLGATQEMISEIRWLARRSGMRARSLPRLTARRGVLAAGVGVLAAFALHRMASRRSRPLRPPGAVPETHFAALCQRCGNCAAVCPSRILHADFDPSRPDSWFTPVVRYGDTYCLESCQRCTEVCPTGALARLTAAEKPHAGIGLPQVDMDVCLLGDDHECGICRNHCPYQAIRVVFSEATYLSTPTVDPALCNGCGACEVQCPTTPVKAIRVCPA